MVTRPDYTADNVAAAKAVLIELVHLLREYREHTVLIGGWVPELLLSGTTSLHVHYPGGIVALAEAFRPHLEHGLIREGIQKIRKNFASLNHMGPKFVEDFEEVEEPAERTRIMRYAKNGSKPFWRG